MDMNGITEDSIGIYDIPWTGLCVALSLEIGIGVIGIYIMRVTWHESFFVVLAFALLL